jgi:hypothetical protein
LFILLLIIGVIGGFLLSGFIGLYTGAIVFSLGYIMYLSWVNSDEKTGQG